MDSSFFAIPVVVGFEIFFAGTILAAVIEKIAKITKWRKDDPAEPGAYLLLVGAALIGGFAASMWGTSFEFIFPAIISTVLAAVFLKFV